jgi:hypothetical protein
LDKFLKTGSPVEDWFNGLIEYRNQILHRQHLIAYSTSNGYFLPDDPSVLGPQGGYFDRKRKRFVTGNFTKRRRIKEYTDLNILESIKSKLSKNGIILNDKQSEVKAISDPSQTAFSQQRAGFSLYNNTDYGIQILYPQDWTAIEGDSKPGDYITNIVTFEPLGEKGKHYSGKSLCGEVCLAISTDYEEPEKVTLDQLSDDLYTGQKQLKGFRLLDLNKGPETKLGDKRAFELNYEEKQGNRNYIQKVMGTAFPDPSQQESKTFLLAHAKTRDKYSGEMLPLLNTMLDSFRFTINSTQENN